MGEKPADGIRDCNDNKELKEKAAERIRGVLLQPLLYRLAEGNDRSLGLTPDCPARTDDRKWDCRGRQMAAGAENQCQASNGDTDYEQIMTGRGLHFDDRRPDFAVTMSRTAKRPRSNGKILY
jgi:hypothetical protein